MELTGIKEITRKLSPERILPSLRENGKLIAQFFLTVLFLGMGIWFLKHERAELTEVRSTPGYARKE